MLLLQSSFITLLIFIWCHFHRGAICANLNPSTSYFATFFFLCLFSSLSFRLVPFVSPLLFYIFIINCAGCLFLFCMHRKQQSVGLLPSLSVCGPRMRDYMNHVTSVRPHSFREVVHSCIGDSRLIFLENTSRWQRALTLRMPTGIQVTGSQRNFCSSGKHALQPLCCVYTCSPRGISLPIFFFFYDSLCKHTLLCI